MSDSSSHLDLERASPGAAAATALRAVAALADQAAASEAPMLHLPLIRPGRICTLGPPVRPTSRM